MLTAFVDDLASVTAEQMDRWCNDFENWAVCDTACFHLFDRTPHAWRKVAQRSGPPEEFVERGAFALLWGLTVDDKTAGDDLLAGALPRVERAATDERHFVKKAVNMACPPPASATPPSTPPRRSVPHRTRGIVPASRADRSRIANTSVASPSPGGIYEQAVVKRRAARAA
jgi:hypothetical protein